MNVRQSLRRAARRTGLAAPLRQLFGSKAARRARIDEQLMRTLMTSVLSPNSNAIDVGSHEGWVLEQVLRVAPRGHHIAYEPVPALCEALTRRYPGVDVRCAALSNVDGMSPFIHVKNHPEWSGLRRVKYSSRPVIEIITVNTERLDDHLPPGYAPNLIKIDVEGAERLVIEGALKTIATHRPVVIFEHGKGAPEYYQTGPTDVFRLLVDEARLRILDLDGDRAYSLDEFEETFQRNERWNFVARP